jgi:LemA protein
MAGLLVYGSYISAQYQMEALRTSAHEQWVQLDGALRRWAGEAPRLEATVAPAAKSNPQVLDALASAERALRQAHDPKAVAAASRALAECLNGVIAMGMSHAQVKTDAEFGAARERLRTMRRRVEEDRDRYNESLRNYDLFVGEFPNSLWAKIAGYKPDEGFLPQM